MATEYDNDIRVWLEELRRLESDSRPWNSNPSCPALIRSEPAPAESACDRNLIESIGRIVRIEVRVGEPNIHFQIQIVVLLDHLQAAPSRLGQSYAMYRIGTFNSSSMNTWA